MIDATAAGYAARLDGARALTPEEAAELDLWLAKDSRHRGALIRAQAALALLDGLRSRDAPRSIPRREGLARRALLGGGAAAAAAGFAGLAIWNAQRGAPQTFSTQPGELRRLSVASGMQLTLDARSVIRLAPSRSLEEVVLEAGRAWFDLRESASVPLRLDIGDLRVMASHASFSAERRDERVDLLVTEGWVEAWNGRGGARSRLGRGAQATLVRADFTSRSTLTAEALERAAAWTTGRLALDGETVADAIDMFNRHNALQIVSRSADLNRQPLVGYFRLDDPEGFVAALEASFAARAHHAGNAIVLS